MKFLADENLPRPTVHALRENGFEIAWVAEDSPGSSDEEVLARCAQSGFTLLTLDKDFGELVFRGGLPAECGVILFRVDAESPAQFTEIALAALRSRDDWNGFFSVVGGGRIRMRRLRGISALFTQE
jgi:predicted nuclease of predicted toxin-antitoxin system